MLIKLDCEGNELAILKGASSVLERSNIDFIIEVLLDNDDRQEIFNLMRGFGFDAYLMTHAEFVKQDRPLTIPFPGRRRTMWANQFFTKRNIEEIREVSLRLYGYWI